MNDSFRLGAAFRYDAIFPPLLLSLLLSFLWCRPWLMTVVISLLLLLLLPLLLLFYY